MSPSRHVDSDVGVSEQHPHSHHYCVVRRDLALGPMLAQLIHAAGESAVLGPTFPTEGTHSVALAAPDERALLDLERTLQTAAVAHVAIREPDEPFCGQLVAIGLAPVFRTPELRRLLRHLPLLK